MANTETGELPAARKPQLPLGLITPDDVRASIKRAKRSLEKAAEEIVGQIEVEGWRTLGYRSWNAMRDDEYGDVAFIVPAKQHPELVARMRATGLTNPILSARRQDSVTCGVCGESFAPVRSGAAVYCSAACRQRAYRQRRAEHPPPPSR